MKHRLTAGIVSTVLLAAGGMFAAQAATAHDAAFDSRVTIRNPSDPVYTGRVFSESPRCIGSRTVKLFTADGILAGQDETDAEGRWRVEFVGKSYYAKVTREVRGRTGHRHVCRADRSRTITSYP